MGTIYLFGLLYRDIIMKTLGKITEGIATKPVTEPFNLWVNSLHTLRKFSQDSRVLLWNFASKLWSWNICSGVRTLAVPHDWDSESPPSIDINGVKCDLDKKHWCMPYHLPRSSMGARTLNLGDSVFLYTGTITQKCPYFVKGSTLSNN